MSVPSQPSLESEEEIYETEDLEEELEVAQGPQKRAMSKRQRLKPSQKQEFQTKGKGVSQRFLNEQQEQQEKLPQQKQPNFQGVQGPFGRFRGESLSSWTEAMPTSVEELFKNIQLESMMIENWVRKRLVLVGDQQPLDKALQRLNRHKITSLPIISEETGKILGILDSLDIVNYLSTVLDQEAIGPARWDFNLKTTGELLALSKNRGLVMSNQANIYEALGYLSKGVPRIMVVDSDVGPHLQEKEEEGILGLFTQSDVVRFLAANPYWLNLHPLASKKLEELNLFSEPEEHLISVDQNTPAFMAFKLIAEASAGVVVVDDDGRIVANLTASNIRGISRRNFQLLRRPLFEFLQRDRRRGWWTMPVCLKLTDTLEKTVLQFGSTKVHQMFICDSYGHPKHTVTLTHILRQFYSKGLGPAPVVAHA